tara:strand:+ start:1021 stop:2058 length:1038 start_codon:yes stop_codon:yes gene_type:complete
MVGLRKLSSTNAFVVTDLIDVPSFGIVRSAKKILQGGAKDLARSMTYTFASFEMQRGGASGGINATPDEKEEAIENFVSELGDDVGSGSLGLDAGKGIAASSFAKLVEADARSDMRFAEQGSDQLETYLAALGPIVVAEQLSGLEGKALSIEGFGNHGPAMMDLIAERGGKVVSISTLSGSISNSDGLDAEEIRSQWDDDGIDFVKSSDGEAEPAWKVFQSGADILFAGSKMGAVSHVTAEKLQVQALIPHQPIPFTARALAMLQRKGTVVAPDFIAVAGPIFAAWPKENETSSDVIASATSMISDALAESLKHEDGLFLGACYRAESFLASWHHTKLFGRPLAS